MTEAAGLAASIVGLVGAALKVSGLCYEYFSEAMNAQEDIKRLVTEISSLANLLKPLSTLAEASKIPDPDSISLLAQQCTKMLEDLEGKLQHQSNIGRRPDSKTQKFLDFVGSSKSSLKWPFKKEGTRERIQEIERLKTAVVLKLQM